MRKRKPFDFEDDRIKDAVYKFTKSGNTIIITEGDGVTSYTLTERKK